MAATAVLFMMPLSWYWAQLKRRRRKKLPYPPGPKGSFFFGNAFQLPDISKGEFIEGKLLEWMEDFDSDMITVHFPVVGRMIIVGNPDLANYITVTKNFQKGFSYRAWLPIIGNQSLIILEGSEWKAKRRAFNPGFGPAFLKDMVAVMAEKMHRFLSCIDQDIEDNAITNTLARAQTFTSDVIVSIGFGEDWGGSNPHDARLWLTDLLKLLIKRSTSAQQIIFGFSLNRKVKELEHKLDNEMRKILELRLRAGVSPNSRDICSLGINELRQPDGSLLESDKVSICHQMKTFYFAGHVSPHECACCFCFCFSARREMVSNLSTPDSTSLSFKLQDTTATLISWAVWTLSQHPDKLQKLRAELKSNKIWLSAELPPTYDQLMECIYLDAILKECLRLYPPAGSARFTSDLNESFDGYCIGGAVLYLAPYTIHRNPRIWKQPNDFLPERFLDGSEGDVSNKFIPFMRGPRDCIGKYFAMLEGKLAISAIVSFYNLECVNPNDAPGMQLTLVPRDGAKIKFSRRPKDISE